jgi:hypothetical protein
MRFGSLFSKTLDAMLALQRAMGLTKQRGWAGERAQVDWLKV